MVSESTKTTDYRAKCSEYAVLDIQEYWSVDPLDELVLRLLYDSKKRAIPQI
ncbi:MAG: Uma2 family endonuclease [Leptolyngbya sp. Prado105]|nr:Uma2 family endonuclease [Leptolyngbya sp. Prado105]